MQKLGDLRASPPGKFLRIDVKYCNLETFPHFYFAIIMLQQHVLNMKVSISSNNHMMHPLTISGNRHVRAQYRFIMADSFKEFQEGSREHNPQRFLQSKGFKIP